MWRCLTIIYLVCNIFQLRQVGFANIDALDPNEALLEIAKKQNLYNKYFMEYLTAEPCSITEGLYHQNVSYCNIVDAMTRNTQQFNNDLILSLYLFYTYKLKKLNL